MQIYTCTRCQWLPPIRNHMVDLAATKMCTCGTNHMTSRYISTDLRGKKECIILIQRKYERLSFAFILVNTPAILQFWDLQSVLRSIPCGYPGWTVLTSIHSPCHNWRVQRWLCQIKFLQLKTVDTCWPNGHAYGLENIPQYIR